MKDPIVTEKYLGANYKFITQLEMDVQKLYDHIIL